MIDNKEVIKMSIKPIDFQVLIPRTTDVAKMNSDETHKNTALQQQQAASTQHKADNTLKQVYSQSRPQDVKITQKQKENNRKDRNKDKKKETQGNIEKKVLKNGTQTSTIDIKI